MPAPLPSWFAERAARLLAEPDYVHTDSCSWLGGDAEHPCSCRVPELLRVVAGCAGSVADLPLALERAFDYVDRVPEDPLPDATSLPRAPATDNVTKWLTTWKPVRFRMRGQWWIGVVKAQVQLLDGSWVLQVEYGGDGLHQEWPHQRWLVHDEQLVMPVDAEAP